MGVAKVKVLPKGQITLPKKIRKALGISEGDVLVVFRRGEEIVLRKRKTLFELAGSLPNLGLSLEEMREKALAIDNFQKGDSND